MTYRCSPPGGRRLRPLPVLGIAVLAFVLASCGLFIVDSEARSTDFCERNEELLTVTGIDEPGGRYNEAQAEFFSEEYAQTMRYAEDGTRELRREARSLEESYDDVREMVGADNVPEDEEIEKYEELREGRAKVRAICEEFLVDAPDEGVDAPDEGEEA